ncbi:MAG: arginine--tRNA ligase [Christensenellales bacterium]|jgi:arginyl-tRNA synthetase
MDFKKELSLIIDKCLEKEFGQRIEGIEDYIETPPNPEMGDFAFPCFRLAKALRKAPNAIAEQLAKSLGGSPASFLSKVQQNGGYLNFFVDGAFFARAVIGAVKSQGEKYGASDIGAGKTVCLDFSSINIAKKFHIGHLYTTVIGHSLKRIYEHLGYKTVSINHLGDWGSQFGKLIVAYKKWGSKEKVEERLVDELVELYIRYHEEAEKEPSLDDEARAWFKKMEDGDGEALEIYGWFKRITLTEAAKTYDLLDIHFDSYNGEAFYNDKMEPVVEELREKGLLKYSDGAQIVDLSEYDMPPMLVLRSDGASLYHTRDLAAAFYRKKEYNFDKSLYVVAYQQNLHFKQLFKVVELMGYDWAKDLIHVNYGMVSMEDGSLSTRHGRIIYLDELLAQSIAKVKDIMQEKSPDLNDMDAIARDVGVGAVIFSALYTNRIKDVVFSWDRALNFDGEAGPYVQYTHARCCSVLARAGEIWAVADYSALTDPYSQQLLAAIAKFPQTVKDAAERNEPYLITRSVVAVAQAFNKFYYENRIIDGDPGIKAARVALTDAAKTAIKTGLHLIGIKAPARM